MVCPKCQIEMRVLRCEPGKDDDAAGVMVCACRNDRCPMCGQEQEQDMQDKV